MPDNLVRTKGRSTGYKFDRGGTPAEFGPFIGVVKNNIDPTRGGRLQVWIRQFSGDDEDDVSLWRTVSYVPPFYGSTSHTGTGVGIGTFTGNQQSYGMWFTPPDIGVSVICFFVEGDPNQGYYTGVIPDPGINHMLPAIGASKKFELSGQGQDAFLAKATQLPVTEINTANPAIAENPRFFDQPKPVHSVVAGIMMQQGLITDNTRGPITSNSQRETPSAVFGIATPGKPIYQNGASELDIKNQLESGQLRPQDVAVIGRRGGHTLVMDDGDLQGKDALLRIRTAKGHQITMSDDGDCFYIIHANGQTWLEFGKQGTVDVFSSNSVNVRTQGTINLHADKDININAGSTLNIKSKVIKMQADAVMDVNCQGPLTLYSKAYVGVRSDGSLALQSSQTGSWDGGGSLALKAGCIDLNGGGAPSPVKQPSQLKDFRLADTVFDPRSGWQVVPGRISTIVTRAPTHEPYPYHNQGVDGSASFTESTGATVSGTAAQTLKQLATATPEGKINDADYISQAPAVLTVGSINTAEVTGLLAQTAAVVKQPAEIFSLDKGLGKYGLSPEQLESTGYLKPGTSQQYRANPAQLENILTSPSVWTGREGINTLNSMLSNPAAQDLAQQEVMVNSLRYLQQAGIVTGTEKVTDLAPLVQTASIYGPKLAEDWALGRAPADVTQTISNVAKGAQYAINFVDTKLPGILTSGIELGGFTDTANRGSIDRAVASIIGNDKIPVPTFGTGLFTSVPNDQLVYSGDDPVVLERINAERRARGLPPLPARTGTST